VKEIRIIIRRGKALIFQPEPERAKSERRARRVRVRRRPRRLACGSAGPFLALAGRGGRRKFPSSRAPPPSSHSPRRQSVSPTIPECRPRPPCLRAGPSRDDCGALCTGQPAGMLFSEDGFSATSATDGAGGGRLRYQPRAWPFGRQPPSPLLRPEEDREGPGGRFRRWLRLAGELCMTNACGRRSSC